MTRQIGVGVIGLGMAGRGHLQSFASNKKVKAIYGADPSDKARSDAGELVKEAKFVADYKELLRMKEIDLVVIATPHNLHLPMVLDSFTAGKNVMTEKPMAINTKECDLMIAAAKGAKKQLFVFHNQRSSPMFYKLKKIISENDFGKAVAAVIQYLGCELQRMRDSSNWKCSYDKAGGGVLLDGGIHVIDMCNWYLGKPVSVIARLHKPENWLENKAESTGNLLITYESGAIAQVLASFETLLPGSFGEGTLRILADLFYENGNASAMYEYLGKFGMKSYAQFICGSDEMHEFKPTDKDKISIHENVLDCLLDDAKPLITPEEARTAVAVVEAAYESARTGRSVMVQ